MDGQEAQKVSFEVIEVGDRVYQEEGEELLYKVYSANGQLFLPNQVDTH